jgi:hypothetical protein
MKKFVKPVVFGVIFIVCLFVINTGCKKKAECSGAEALCGNHTFTACCTDGTDCYYLVDDSDKFSCNGSDCEAAAIQLINTYCTGGAAGFSKQQVLATVERVLQAVK